ncbi:MAG: hypothetical protein AAB641_01525 [Patescibacteria group bacterium]|mgnify:CR=1 FL=1
MEINQFVEFSAAIIRSLPRDLDTATAQRWIREQGTLSEVLRKALTLDANYELYLTPEQKLGGMIKGFDLKEHLKNEKLIKRCLSLESPLVNGWLADPSTYPEELKTKAVFLFGSQRASGSEVRVADLCWRDDRVVVGWYWLGYWWFGDRPVLLASS